MRLGVIGLGWRWRHHYRPALLALRPRFTVTLLCDQVADRAEREAKRLGCGSAGAGELLDSPNVEEVVLPDAQWFRLWPLERAGALGKPVLCSSALEQDEAHADAICRLAAEGRAQVMIDHFLIQAPLFVRLRELLNDHLGQVQQVTCDLIEQRRELSAGGCSLSGEVRRPCGGLYLPDSQLLGACGALLTGDPVAIAADQASGAGSLRGVFLDWGGGRAAHVRRWSVPGRLPQLSFQVSAEHGFAKLVWPDRLCWSVSPELRHAQRLKPDVLPLVPILEEFAHCAHNGQRPHASLQEETRWLAWARAAAQSRVEQRRIALACGS